MLQCTEAAASTLERLREQQGIPDDLALRLFPAQTDEEEIVLGLDFAEPQEGDQVTEEHGARVLVAGEIADQLADMTLDVVPDPSSNGQRAPQLVLRQQPPG